MNASEIPYAQLCSTDCSLLAITLLVLLTVIGMLIQLAVVFSIIHLVLHDSTGSPSPGRKKHPRAAGYS